MIGDLKEQVTLLQVQSSPDGGGGKNQIWTDIAVVWAKLDWLRGKATRLPYRSEILRRVRLLIRGRDDLNDRNRLRIRGHIYRITSLQPFKNTDHFIILEAEEVLR